jgi:2',3'-cyclic-nucleotide 2'-phosphodiesterase (5'-nucleotidase family)
MPDAAMEQKILPYKLRLEQKMNDTVNFATHKLSKDRPEGTLGNLVTESLMAYLKEKGYESDLCLTTTGGLRIPELPAGLVTVGKVFELQPFDNEVVILTIRGDSLQKLLNFVAARGGDPISGVRFTIKNKQAVDVKVGDRELNSNQTYKLLTSDYLANGGDNLYMLAKPVSYTQTGLALRDALIDYWKLLKKRNQPLEAKIDGRIKLE